jgi:hypothetical protein
VSGFRSGRVEDLHWSQGADLPDRAGQNLPKFTPNRYLSDCWKIRIGAAKALANFPLGYRKGRRKSSDNPQNEKAFHGIARLPQILALLQRRGPLAWILRGGRNMLWINFGLHPYIRWLHRACKAIVLPPRLQDAGPTTLPSRPRYRAGSACGAADPRPGVSRQSQFRARGRDLETDCEGAVRARRPDASPVVQQRKVGFRARPGGLPLEQFQEKWERVFRPELRKANTWSIGPESGTRVSRKTGGHHDDAVRDIS